MKRSFLLLLCLALVVICMVACGDPADTTTPAQTTADPHEHTWADTWSCDEGYHWYAATCEHTDEKANYAAHIDAENDGVCDTCGYGSDHEHTYATEWTTDETGHWYAPTCGHSVKGSEGTHTDADNDGACDTCGYTGGHEHTYATEWSSDANDHWYAVTCGHAVEVKDKAAHADADNDGACDTCGYTGGHEHTYATEWSSDANDHWYAVTCGHAVEVKGKAAHADADNDGACDTCGYNGGHTHTWSDKWSYDDDNHWNDVSCGHSIDVANKGAHVDNNGDYACDTCGYSSHKHTFDTTTWVYNDTQHWHAASCGCSLKIDIANHSDPDNDGACNVCEWNDGCEHPYSDEWSFDANNHWHAVTCGHSIANIDVAAHVDANKDGICEICNGYDKDHEHTFDEGKWTVGANGHWVKVTCGHTGYIQEYFPHNDMTGDGLCDVCGGLVSFQSAIDLATSTESADKVNGGTIYDANSKTTYTYAFGDGYFYIKEDYNGTITESYYMIDADGEILGIKKFTGGWNDGKIQRDNGAEMSYMDGPEISCGAYTYYNIYNVRGVENALYSLYNWAKASINGGIGEEAYDEETGVYSFRLNYYESSDWSTVLYDITVSFTMTDDYVVDSLTIHTISYSGDGIVYNESTGTYEIAEGVEPDQDITMTINQTVGERTAVSPYNPEDIFFSSFDFVDAEGNLMPETVYLTAGELQYYYLANILPETAIASLENINCVAPSGITAYYSTYSNYLMLKGSVAGTFEVTVSTMNVTKTITLVVSYPPATYANAQTYEESYGSYSGTETDEVTVYVGQTIYFGVAVNEYADGAYTYKVVSGDMSAALIKDEVLENWDGSIQANSFMALTTGTYEIEMTLTSNPALSTTLTITVKNPPSIDEVLSGEYTDLYGQNKLTFTPDSEGATTGTVEMITSNWWGEQSKEVCTYVYENGEIVLTHVSGDSLGYTLQINADYSISYVSWGYEQATMTQVAVEEEDSFDASVLDGTWTDYDGAGFTMTLDSATMSGTFTYGESVVAFTFELSESSQWSGTVYNITFTEDAANHVNPEAALAVFDFDTVNGGSFYGNTFYDPSYDEIFLVAVHPMTQMAMTWYLGK